ncbi:MAG: WYL domain-containing protein, partial [Ktedonobacteraceae bacterium]|nr:WYL domain-containing protein [Ktedonobacteraceae bacterium]
YGLVFRGLSRRHARVGIWYLVAFCRDCHDFNVFRVGHIEKLKVRKEAVLPRPDFDLRAYWQEARKSIEETEPSVSLKLRVSSSARHNLRGELKILGEEPDGSVLVRIEVESIEAAISYVLSLGSEATVICPSRVRRAVAEKAREIARIYA